MGQQRVEMWADWLAVLKAQPRVARMVGLKEAMTGKKLVPPLVVQMDFQKENQKVALRVERMAWRKGKSWVALMAD